MAAKTSTVTYARLRDGSWGLRGPGLIAGTAVAVARKDGSMRTEAVGKILWTGDGISVSTIAASARASGRNPSVRVPDPGRGEIALRWDGPVSVGTTTRVRGRDGWWTVQWAGQDRISEAEDDCRAGERCWRTIVRPATPEESAEADRLQAERDADRVARASAASILAAGESCAPVGRTTPLADAPRRDGSMASLPWLVSDEDGAIYLVTPVYDDSPSYLRLTASRDAVLAAARILGWRMR